MKAADVMKREVITARPNATLEAVLDLLVTHRISAVPVVDDKGAVVGIVSEGDLLRRSEAGTEHRRSRWLELFIPEQTLALEFVKSHSRRVTDVMTRNVIAVTPDTPLAEVATVLEKNRIKRVPVVQDGKLVGIVSRADLVRTLANLYKNVAAAPVSDEHLRQSIMAELANQAWAHPDLISIEVHDGTVDISGLAESSAEKHAIRIAAESLPGVKAVNDRVNVYKKDAFI
jgi:CBS domain-containing protein